MTDTAKATTLKTEPIATAPEQRAVGGQPQRFAKGDPILFHVKHLHALHGTIVESVGDGQYVVRGDEEAIEGQIFQFSGDGVDLDGHHSTRLEWDYED